jgi:PTS system nitrogen regulatory IIA component
MTMQSSDTNPQFDLIIPSLIAANHKQLVRAISGEIAVLIGINERILAERFLEKEKANPSAIGDGISIMHLQLSGLRKSTNIFLRLKNPVAMNAADKRDVDIVCVLLTPEREGSSYLRTLARISRLLRNAQICARLRAASDEKALRHILEQSSAQSLAA